MIEEETSGGSNTTVTLQWTTIEELSSFDRNNSGIAHYAGGTLWDNPPVYSSATNTGINTWTQTRSGFTSFSPFVVRDNLNEDLPVEMLYFNAERLNANEVQLDWATSSETNNKGFFIERMLEDETSFIELGFVEGNGTTTIPQYYNFLDNNSYPKISYYRLRQVDFDGSFQYSEIRAVKGSENNMADIAIFPNPVDDLLNIRFYRLPENTQYVNIKILGINGQTIHEFNSPIQSYQVLDINNMQNIPLGVYTISIQTDSGFLAFKKFIKK
ncbi:MAG: T9SS type A sorting domain-containing protein [Aureispira sp.]|nr:T9SS type A sorting domain-containing protein [Aureispira sp.]